MYRHTLSRHAALPSWGRGQGVSPARNRAAPPTDRAAPSCRIVPVLPPADAPGTAPGPVPAKQRPCRKERLDDTPTGMAQGGGQGDRLTRLEGGAIERRFGQQPLRRLADQPFRGVTEDAVGGEVDEPAVGTGLPGRSEGHPSEPPSLMTTSNAVFRLT